MSCNNCSSPQRWVATIEPSTPVAIAMRINGLAGTPITQATVTSIARRVVNNETEDVTLNDTVSVAAVIFDTLQAWNEDAIGYNFRNIVPASAFPDASGSYSVKYTFVTNPSTDGPIVVNGTVTTL